MNITSTEVNDILVLKIHGRLTVSSDDEFKSEMLKISETAHKVVLDCSEMEYLDSTGLGLIVRFYKDFVARGGKFALAALQPKPKLVFEITRAYKIFDIYDSSETAIKTFA